MRKGVVEREKAQAPEYDPVPLHVQRGLPTWNAPITVLRHPVAGANYGNGIDTSGIETNGI